MSSQKFEKLLEPGFIGKVRTRNRIIKTANGTSFIEPTGYVGDRALAYYEAMAKGGVGLTHHGVLRCRIPPGRPAPAGPVSPR